MPKPSKRDQIAEATKQLLWEVGYEAMSPRDIQARSAAGRPRSGELSRFTTALIQGGYVLARTFLGETLMRRAAEGALALISENHSAEVRRQLCGTPNDTVLEFVHPPINVNDFPHQSADPARQPRRTRNGP
jgi:hypothetical protein